MDEKRNNVRFGTVLMYDNAGRVREARAGKRSCIGIGDCNK